MKFQDCLLNQSNGCQVLEVLVSLSLLKCDRLERLHVHVSCGCQILVQPSLYGHTVMELRLSLNSLESQKTWRDSTSYSHVQVEKFLTRLLMLIGLSQGQTVAVILEYGQTPFGLWYFVPGQESPSKLHSLQGRLRAF
jgi:hypothetical protein